MPKKPKHTQELIRSTVEYECDGVYVSCPIDDIKAWEAECGVCGSHGGVDIIVKECPLCKKEHEINMKGW